MFTNECKITRKQNVLQLPIDTHTRILLSWVECCLVPFEKHENHLNTQRFNPLCELSLTNICKTPSSLVNASVRSHRQLIGPYNFFLFTQTESFHHPLNASSSIYPVWIAPSQIRVAWQPPRKRETHTYTLKVLSQSLRPKNSAHVHSFTIFAFGALYAAASIGIQYNVQRTNRRVGRVWQIPRNKHTTESVCVCVCAPVLCIYLICVTCCLFPQYSLSVIGISQI